MKECMKIKVERLCGKLPHCHYLKLIARAIWGFINTKKKKKNSKLMGFKNRSMYHRSMYVYTYMVLAYIDTQM